MGKKKLNFDDALRDLAKTSQATAEAEATALRVDPVLAVHKLNEAIEMWEANGGPEFTRDDMRFLKFIKAASRETTGELLVVMRKVIGLLSAKLDQIGDMVTPRELSAIFAELGKQVAMLQKMEDQQYVPPSESDLDKKIRELENKLDEDVVKYDRPIGNA